MINSIIYTHRLLAIKASGGEVLFWRYFVRTGVCNADEATCIVECGGPNRRVQPGVVWHERGDR